jgi:hypothetical protein
MFVMEWRTITGIGTFPIICRVRKVVRWEFIQR